MNKRAVAMLVVLFYVITIGGAIFVHAADYNEEKENILSELEQQIQEREDEIRKLQERAQSYRSEIETAQQQKDSLQRQITVITARINALEVDIAVTRAQIESATLQISRVTQDIVEKETAIDQTIERMAAILRTLDRQDNETLLEITLRHGTLSDALGDYDHLSRLSDVLDDELTELRELKIALEEQREGAEERRKELQELNAQLGSQHGIVASQRNQQNTILQETRGREENYQRLLTQAEEQEREIQREIFEFEDQLRRTLDPEAIPAPRSGILKWPQGGILTQRYGSTSETGFLNNTYTFHNGIDIASGFGAPIKAARDGTVKAMGDNGRFAYGKWVVIEHNNGLSTLYAHLSGWNVNTGQTVNAGEIVGFEGSTGFSTGSHLHFTVYVTHTIEFLDRWYGLLPRGASLDPLDYL